MMEPAAYACLGTILFAATVACWWAAGWRGTVWFIGVFSGNIATMLGASFMIAQGTAVGGLVAAVIVMAVPFWMMRSMRLIDYA